MAKKAARSRQFGKASSKAGKSRLVQYLIRVRPCYIADKNYLNEDCEQVSKDDAFVFNQYSASEMLHKLMDDDEQDKFKLTFVPAFS